MPIKYHPTANMNPTGVPVDQIPLTLSSDVDLTDPTGPTGGYCARALLIGSTAGNVVVMPAGGDTYRTIPVAANQQLQGAVQTVRSIGNGTTAATVTALL